MRPSAAVLLARASPRAFSTAPSPLVSLARSLPHARCPFHGAGCAGAHTSAPPATDSAFEIAASTIRFGAGATRELGHDVHASGAASVLVFTDPSIAALGPRGPLARALDSLTAAGFSGGALRVFPRCRVEPTDGSFAEAIAEARAFAPGAYVAVGGGSVMDTAKAANLYASHPGASFLDFVNAPVGKGLPVPGPVKPLFALPTTAGTGSETTGVAIFDYRCGPRRAAPPPRPRPPPPPPPPHPAAIPPRSPLHAKTGIASRVIKPTLGLVDPDNMASVPPQVAVAAGFDVLCHALESFTALPFSQRGPAPATPAQRPAYQGANPFSDVWAAQALRLLAKYFVRSVKDRGDAEAREGMAFAATAAGVGFGSAGVHLAHGMSYAISGLNRAYCHPGYAAGVKLVPHGISVCLPAPAIFRRTAAVSPGRHLTAARLLAGEDAPVAVGMSAGAAGRGGGGGGGGGGDGAEAGSRLADQLLRYMEALGVPDGLGALGYSAGDVPALVEATLPQRRVLALAPSEESSSREALGELFAASMKVY